MMTEDKNTPSKQGKSNPSDPGKDKASIKEGSSKEELKNEDEVKKEHLDEDGEVPSHLESNPNRNPDKPNIHKPKYGGT
jgi:hypothetical protein